VETSTCKEDMEKASKSDLFVPLLLDVAGFDDNSQITGPKFYLADVESIVGLCAVVSEAGGLNNAYFQVKPRREWTEEVVAWVELNMT
jgi:hypothetical protein